MTRPVPGDTLDCLGPLGEPFVTSENMLRWRWRWYCTNVCIASHLQKVNLHKLSWVLEMKAKPSGLICSKIQLYRFISQQMMVV